MDKGLTCIVDDDDSSSSSNNSERSFRFRLSIRECIQPSERHDSTFLISLSFLLTR